MSENESYGKNNFLENDNSYQIQLLINISECIVALNI